MNPDQTTAEHRSQLRAMVEQQLQCFTRGRNWPGGLEEAVNYSLLAGGKRLRPVLVLMAAEVCGGQLERALPAACALEMIHTYSLIHDDLPAMDDDDLRRGRPTCHRVFGEALAILAGDALLTLAFEAIAESGDSAAVISSQIMVLSRAAGGGGMVGGQVLDLDAEKTEKNRGNFVENPADPPVREPHQATSRDSQQKCSSESPESSVEHLDRIHRMKTGALIQAALELGAISAGADQTQVSALRTYGECVGLAFQIADDLLDVSGDSSRLGKNAGRDVDLGKFTYPALMGQDVSRKQAQELIHRACAAIQCFGLRGQYLNQVARFIVERDH